MKYCLIQIFIYSPADTGICFKYREMLSMSLHVDKATISKSIKQFTKQKEEVQKNPKMQTNRIHTESLISSFMFRIRCSCHDRADAAASFPAQDFRSW